MHEMGIASSVLEAVQAEAARRPGAVPVKIAVRVGELSGIDPDALAFSFEALVAGTDLHSLKLEIETRPRQHRCQDCGAAFAVVDYDFACPTCGGLRTQYIGGDELELLYLELEEP
ncbi:MAG TPA: hydrogenase maturation nickel metallochaperone HypA [Verrucomicrobiae bacterium]|nr:hydrogenase maturation nickel metallochaperone HypA [Verrucomicrobiae bacterium]